jgi:hypothetical protein
MAGNEGFRGSADFTWNVQRDGQVWVSVAADKGAKLAGLAPSRASGRLPACVRVKGWYRGATDYWISDERGQAGTQSGPLFIDVHPFPGTTAAGGYEVHIYGWLHEAPHVPAPCKANSRPKRKRR